MPADVADWMACVEHGDAGRFRRDAIVSGAPENGKRVLISRNPNIGEARSLSKCLQSVPTELPEYLSSGLLDGGALDK